jgi:hypothetical protein
MPPDRHPSVNRVCVFLITLAVIRRDGWKDRRTDGQTAWPAGRRTDIEIDVQRVSLIVRRMAKWSDKQTEEKTDKRTDRQTDGWTVGGTDELRTEGQTDSHSAGG